MTSPVFKMPVAPTGRENSSAQLIRIVDPLGSAIAWFAPEFGACCVGYAVRQVGGIPPYRSIWWRELITGSAVPGSASPSSLGKNEEGNAESSWRFVERDPASCTMERKTVEGSRTEHWQMVASLANTQLSLCLRVWSTGTTRTQTDPRLRLVLSSPPDITLDTVSPTGSSDLAELRSDASAHENQVDRIAIAVEAFPGTSTTKTDYLSDKIICTITYHQPDDSTLFTGLNGCQCLSVLIGLPILEVDIEE